MKKNTHTHTNKQQTNEQKSLVSSPILSDILNTFVMNALIFLLIIDTYFHENKKDLVFLCLLPSKIHVTT